MFLTPLHAESVEGGWRLTAPLVWDSCCDPFMVRHTVPAGFVTDLASIPRWARWLISNDDPCVRRPAVLHDWLCREIPQQPFRRYPMTYAYADNLFAKALYSEGVGLITIALCWSAVRIYSLLFRRST